MKHYVDKISFFKKYGDSFPENIEPLKKENTIVEEINLMRSNLSDLKKNVSLYSMQLNTIESIWDYIPAILFFKDMCNNLVRVNNAFCTALGCKREDVEGKNLYKLMHDNKRATMYASNDREVLKTNKPKLGIEEYLMDTDIKLRTDKFPIEINGKVEGILGFSVILNTEKR